jgi:ATP-dependent Clp protease protease subunit
MADHTGQPLDVISKDTDRDNFMSATQAVDYGIVDSVFTNRDKK